MTKTNFVEATIIKNNQEIEIDLPKISYDELPKVSVLTLTYCRSHFFQLMWNNWNNYKYPKEKLEWIIIDDSPGTEHDLFDMIPRYDNIHYIKLDKHMSVGAKRNFGVSKCHFDHIVHQDDDDYYFPDSILAKVRTLKRYPKCGCCFSNSLAAYNVINNISYMMDPQKPESCLALPEASLMFKRSLWEEQQFPSDHFGEGKGFVLGREKKFVSIPCIFNMVSFTHSRNMTGLARNIETKSINSDTRLSNYYDLFDGVTKNIIRKIARLTNKELAITEYQRIFVKNYYGLETECTGDVCSYKELGRKEIDMLSALPNYHTFNTIDDLDSQEPPIGSDDLVLVCHYSTDILYLKEKLNKRSASNETVDDKADLTDTPSILPSGCKEILQHPRSKLLVYNSWECRDFLDPYTKGEFCKYCINQLGVPLDHIILATTDFLNPLVHSLSPQIIGFDFPFLYAKANFNDADISIVSPQQRHKAICMFSRRGNIERTVCALFLHSFHKTSSHLSYLTIDSYSDADITKFGVPTSHYDDFKKLLPIVVKDPIQLPRDIEFDEAAAKIYSNPMVKVNWECQDDIRWCIDDSFVMLTLETNAQGFGSHVQQVSEKTYKAIKMGMPFINFSAKPGIIQHLKSLGFKTFAPFINEDYDYPTFQQHSEDVIEFEIEYYARFRKLTKELNRICNMSHSELTALWNECQPIVLHNLEVLRSQDPKHIKSLPIIEQ